MSCLSQYMISTIAIFIVLLYGGYKSAETMLILSRWKLLIKTFQFQTIKIKVSPLRNYAQQYRIKYKRGTAATL